MTFKIDLDGVIRDILTPMCKLYSKEIGWEFKVEDIRVYDTNASFPLIDNPKKFFFEEEAEEVFLNALPYEGVKEAIDTLRAMGHKVKIVTFQHDYQTRDFALKWLERYNINYDAILFTVTNDKSGVDGDVLIEDCPDNLKREDEETVVRVCIDQPYNRFDMNNDIRVSSVTELVEKYVKTNCMPRKKNTEEEEIKTELDAVITIANELKKIRREMESLNMQIGMMSARNQENKPFYK